MTDAFFSHFDLDILLRSSYVDWLGVAFGEEYESRRLYLERVRYNSYFSWLQLAIQEIYRIREPITADNWDAVSDKIGRGHGGNHGHLTLLQQMCKYKRIILDAYWSPGSHNGHPEVFAPSFRVNQFLYDYGPNAQDRDEGNPAPDWWAENIDEYVGHVRAAIVRQKERGCVALKCSVAYRRGVDFKPTTRTAAERVLYCQKQVAEGEDIKAFQDYLFFEVCKIAAEMHLPLQCHVGSGSLAKTNPIYLQDAIAAHPETKFVLFHCGYPWLDDVCGLVQKYPNVYPDLCWVPLISVSAARRILAELIDIGTADKVCWGCDTWTAEESYAALLAVRHVLVTVLGERVGSRLLSLDGAKAVADNILFNNARGLYQLDSPLLP